MLHCHDVMPRVLGVTPPAGRLMRVACAVGAGETTALVERDQRNSIGASRGTYAGSPRIHADLAASGTRSAQAGCQTDATQRQLSTLRDDDGARRRPSGPDLHDRKFRRGARCCGLPTSPTFRHGAASPAPGGRFDMFSHCVVGWSMSTTRNATGAGGARAQRSTYPQARGVIHHSEFKARSTIRWPFAAALPRDVGVRPSMGSVGDAYDNAMAESFFFATLQVRAAGRATGFQTQTRHAAPSSSSSKVYYNPRRRHRSAICRPDELSASIPRPCRLPTHQSLPACSPGQTSSAGAPERARPDGCCAPRLGAVVGPGKERAPWGLTKNRTTRGKRTRHITSREPKSSTVHENRAGSTA